MTEEMIRKISYTKEEVDRLIAEAVAEARRIDEESMRCLLYTSDAADE